MGGADNNGNGLAYSQRLTGIVPGQTAGWQQEDMEVKRIEGVAVLLPDGTVFLCSGASGGQHHLPDGICTRQQTITAAHTPVQQ